MKYPIYLVTGAPGSGKSAALQAFLELESNYLAFDIDWLVESGSRLAGKSIIFDHTTWKPYRTLWFDILLSVHKNGRAPLLFATIDHDELKAISPEWVREIHWLLLDCADESRQRRLRSRANWTPDMLREAGDHAAKLRRTIADVIDTDIHHPEEVARLIQAWVQAWED